MAPNAELPLRRLKRRMPPPIDHNLSVVYNLRVVNNRKVVHNGDMGRFDPAPTLAAGLLRLARDKAAMTQTDLAVQAGVSQQSISAYETGRKEPTLPTLVRLLAAAGIEMRIRLEPIDDHDSTLETFIETLPPSRQAELIEESRARVAAERLNRIRGQ
jgi:transcriptional regulator with XRE-family HTH domain